MRPTADVRPVPDPTMLTNALVNSAVGNLEARILVRLDAMAEASALRLDAINKVPEDIANEILHLRELIDQRFKGVDIRFESIQQQFAERDIRVETGARASKEALDAALLAAKELVGTTNTANTIAAAKSEESTAKQIDAIAAQIRTGGEATDARIADLKERIDRGEGGTAGARDQRTEHRLDSSAIVALVAVILVAIGIAVSVGLAVAIH